MNIKEVVNILNKELGGNIPSDYYTRIEEWRQWWAGYVKTFHHFRETTDNGKKKDRDLYSMKMAKKLCEDWAAYLLNEKTRIEVMDPASSEFLQGQDGDQETGGVFKDISFWEEANALVEKAFYSGTGAFVMKLDGLPVGDDGSVLASKDASIRMEYLPAQCIIPITVKYHRITEVAFASENTVRGKKYVLDGVQQNSASMLGVSTTARYNIGTQSGSPVAAQALQGDEKRGIVRQEPKAPGSFVQLCSTLGSFFGGGGRKAVDALRCMGGTAPS